MVSFMMSSRTAKPSPSDARRGMCRDENLLGDVHMEQ